MLIKIVVGLTRITPFIMITYTDSVWLKKIYLIASIDYLKCMVLMTKLDVLPIII